MGTVWICEQTLPTTGRGEITTADLYGLNEKQVQSLKIIYAIYKTDMKVLAFILFLFIFYLFICESVWSSAVYVYDMKGEYINCQITQLANCLIGNSFQLTNYSIGKLFTWKIAQMTNCSVDIYQLENFSIDKLLDW